MEWRSRRIKAWKGCALFLPSPPLFLLRIVELELGFCWFVSGLQIWKLILCLHFIFSFVLIFIIVVKRLIENSMNFLLVHYILMFGGGVAISDLGKASGERRS